MSGDTIFALASGAPPVAVAVVRVSGPQARCASEALTGRLPPPRSAALRRLRDPATGDTLDHGLVLFFPAPASFTGEDCLELHLHGGRAVLAAVLAALSRLPGCRPAERGEFTRRAFVNGKMDLAGAEGLADLLSADTERQRHQALRQIEGQLSTRAAAWRAGLVDGLASVEAALDFADEADVAHDARAEMVRAVTPVLGEIEAALATAAWGEVIREGFVVALAGPPNAGKSSLLNRLARREAALVSPIAGTTRDIIEVRLDLGGASVILLDTAGLRQSDDPIERMGVERAQTRIAAADLVIWLDDGAASVAMPPRGALLIDSKIDRANSPRRHALGVSAATGAGVEALVAAIAARAALAAGGDEPALVTNARQRRELTDAQAALLASLDIAAPDEIAAEHLRRAARRLAALVGAIDTDAVLDAIFARFCIGK